MFNPNIGEVDPSALVKKKYSPSNPKDIELDELNKAHVKGNDYYFNGDELLNTSKKKNVGTKSNGEMYELSDVYSNDEYDTLGNKYHQSSKEEDEQDEEDESIYPNGGHEAYLVVFGSFLSCFTLFGIMNVVGVIEAFVQNNQLHDISVTSVSWIFSVYMFVSLFMGIIVGPMYDTFGASYLVLAGSLFTFVGLFTTGSSKSLYQFILSFGVCTGLGTGLMMFPTISVISSWFVKKKRSVYMGAAQSGGSVAGIFFPILLRYLFPKYGFKSSLRIFASFNLGVDIVAVVLIKDRLKEIREFKGESEDTRSFWLRVKDSVDLGCFRDKKLLFLTSALFMNEFSLLIVLTYLASYAIAYGASASESYLMITILNVSGTFGKLIPSYLSQKFGTFNMMILMSLSMTLESFIIWLPFGKHKSALYVFIVMFGFAYSATYSLTGATINTITRKSSDFGKRFGSAYAIVSFGNLISLPISGAFIVNKTTQNYDNMVAFAAATCGVATILFLVSRWTVVGWKFKVAI